MKVMIQGALDVALFAAAAFLALLLRENFVVGPERLVDFLPYALAMMSAAIVVFPSVGLHNTIWRLSTMADFRRAASAAVIATIVGVALAFAVNRLDGVARSLPVLQLILGVCALVGVRVIARQYHRSRQERRQWQAPLKVVDHPDTENVLVVGLTPLAEAYLQAVAGVGDQVRIVGILGRSERQVGRSVGAVPVLGVPQDVASVVDTLETHGVFLDRIVVALPFRDLQPDASSALLAMEAMSAIPVRFLADELVGPGTEQHRRSRSSTLPTPPGETLSFEFKPVDLSALGRRRYWGVKRAVDFSVAAVLLLLLWPMFFGVALAVAMSIGSPITFWQQRPGLGGAPFRVYKFRTMKAARDVGGRLLSDEERTSAVGVFLRRTRLDELPQLLNILKGEMSFVGPRPLLPRDQSEAYRARLLVRPGLTGWAQVVGGRAISAEDKAALDVWYVRHASLRLDLEILLRTIPMVVCGERMNEALIRRAWSDLVKAEVVVGPDDRRRAMIGSAA